MIYYAVAMTVTLILCYYQTTAYPMRFGGQTHGFQSFRNAFLVLLPLIFLAVFRWDVGYDSRYGSSYWIAYQASADGINSRDLEWGFYWFMRIFAELEVPYFWFLFTHGLLFMVGVCYAVAKGSVWSRWSILTFFLLFVYFDCYSSLRQSLAESVCLIAWADMGYRSPSKKRDLWIIGLFFVAGLLHKIAWMNIPVFILCKLRFSRSGLLKFIIFVVLLTPLLQVVLRFAMRLFGGDDYQFTGVAVINAAMTGVFAFACWYFYDEITRLDENAYTYVNLAISIFVLILNSGAMYLPFRVFDMLKIGYVFIIPYLLRGIRDKRLRLYMEFGILAVLGAWFFNQFYLHTNPFTDYQWAFSDWSNIINLP